MATPISPHSPRLLRESLAHLSPKARKGVLRTLTPDQTTRLRYCWPLWAREDQLPPDGCWTYWIINGGRGAGKTRTGAETIRSWARENPITAIVAPTVQMAREICVYGDSGVLSVCPPDERPNYSSHRQVIQWQNGAITHVFSADDPERLRGFQTYKLWADELCAWSYEEAWTQLMFGLRLGARPQAIVTTTPKPKRFYLRLINDAKSHVTKVSTFANQANLAQGFIDGILAEYEGTRLYRQEVHAEVLTDLPGQLFRHEVFDRDRMPAESMPPQFFSKIVIGLDPAASSNENSDETGIVVVGLGPEAADPRKIYVLEDASGVMAPNEWARRVFQLYEYWQADLVVAEKNMGGDMVAHVLRSEAPSMRFQLVTATKGKAVRAEPVSLLYEQGKVAHVGPFSRLEDDLACLTVDFSRAKAGFSPDRADALIWAVSALRRYVQPRSASGAILAPRQTWMS
ncbi:MAG: terminase family protein [Neomegalonema sp.]|nr:terminase family protein [Neomegalonema sp.]